MDKMIFSDPNIFFSVWGKQS